jgi:hypothetical protein
MNEGDAVVVTFKNLELLDDGRHHNYPDQEGADDANPNDSNGGRRTADDSATEMKKTFTAQVYLFPLIQHDDASMGCCWELEKSTCDFLTQTDSPKESVPDACSTAAGGCFVRQSLYFPDVSLIPDFDNNAALTSNGVDYATVSVTLNEAPLSEVSVKLTPSVPGENYMVYVSNCAVIYDEPDDVSGGGRALTTTVKTTSLKADSISLKWTFKNGSLSSGLLPLIPFYAFSFTFYCLLSLLWITRSLKFADSLLGLQKAISILVYFETSFTFIALLYYVHLNKTDVDLKVLYSGTFAALESWDFWSFLVTVTHTSTIFAAQAVVTLVADGKWLIQHDMRKSTRIALSVLAVAWGIFIVFHGAMSPATRRGWAAFSGIMWLLWLLISIRASLRHIKSLTVGSGDDNISVAHPGAKNGDMLTAKRSLFRKMCCLIGTYPIVFGLTLILDSRSDKGSLAMPWLGFVLSDIYIMAILAHTTYMWIPTPAAAEVMGKYAPVSGEDGGWDGDFEMSAGVGGVGDEELENDQ